MNKQCTNCQKHLPKSAFNKRKASKDGLHYTCRRCDHIAGRIYRNSPAVRKRILTEHRRKYRREKAREPHARALALIQEKKRRALPEDKPRQVAGEKLNYALRTGKLTRGECEFKHTGECMFKPQGHHEDYSKPLDVRWLCPRHHRQVHDTPISD